MYSIILFAQTILFTVQMPNSLGVYMTKNIFQYSYLTAFILQYCTVSVVYIGTEDLLPI